MAPLHILLLHFLSAFVFGTISIAAPTSGSGDGVSVDLGLVVKRQSCPTEKPDWYSCELYVMLEVYV